ncbi:MULTISPECIES: spore coat protein [Priestia]|uniref:spore coat protein n=1 Tax=Priestia TaxID=2800373 RepID=UPI0011B7FB64|nr:MULTISPECIES: spore coat protein [Priestia]MCG0050094.1 spore coat protein [Priestia aryabhattai]QDZ88133.1 spore coat protein [Priestia megaterium]USL27618.1 spore coat protein [Priestia megaterium]USL33597.1 spore coat protein [Priestia megaterium]
MGEQKWRALDHCTTKTHNGAVINQEADAVSSVEQESFEWIIVKDSEGVTVNTTDAQVAIQLQVAIQVAIAAVVAILTSNVNQGEIVAEEMTALLGTRQRNSQKTVIEGSINVTVNTTDVDFAANIQVAIQVLIAIFISLLSS